MADGVAPRSSWTSLEVTKLLVSSLTPFAVLLVGTHLSAQSADLAAKRAELDKANARFAAIVDKRAAVWDRVGPLLGKLQRYNDDIGDGVLSGDARTDETRKAGAALNDLADLTLTYNPYFSASFNKAMDSFVNRTQNFYNALQSWQQDRARHRAYGLSTEDLLSFKDKIDHDAGIVRRQLSIELGVAEGTSGRR